MWEPARGEPVLPRGAPRTKDPCTLGLHLKKHPNQDQVPSPEPGHPVGHSHEACATAQSRGDKVPADDMETDTLGWWPLPC